MYKLKRSITVAFTLHHTNDSDVYFLFLVQNACGKSQCKNGGTCQSGFTQKRYRCLCTPGFNGDLCNEGTDNDVFFPKHA